MIRLTIIDNLLIQVANVQQDIMMQLHQVITLAGYVLIVVQLVSQFRNAVLAISTTNVFTVLQLSYVYAQMDFMMIVPIKHVSLAQ